MKKISFIILGIGIALALPVFAVNQTDQSNSFHPTDGNTQGAWVISNSIIGNYSWTASTITVAGSGWEDFVNDPAFAAVFRLYDSHQTLSSAGYSNNNGTLIENTETCAGTQVGSTINLTFNASTSIGGTDYYTFSFATTTFDLTGSATSTCLGMEFNNGNSSAYWTHDIKIASERNPTSWGTIYTPGTNPSDWWFSNPIYWTFQGVPTPKAEISFVFPTNGTTTDAFTNYVLSIANVTSTDECKIEVSDAIPQVLTRVLTPQTFPCGWLVNSGIAVYRPNIPINYFIGATSSPIYATAKLTDLNSGAVATSAITYVLGSAALNILNTTPENVSGTIVVTISTSSFAETFPELVPATSTPGMFQLATSSCDGWMDLTCQLGNAFSNSVNFLFGINQSDIEAIAGFSFATQKPFNTITEIQNAFSSIDTSSSTLVSSTLQINLGTGNTNMTWFDPNKARTMMSETWISFIRGILLAVMTLLLIYGFYLEIKSLFHKKT